MKKLFSILTIFGLINFSTASAENFPDDTEKFNGHHYAVIERYMDFETAKEFCESRGGHLVTITSEEENIFIKEIIHRYATRDFYRIGGIKNNSGEWTWITGEKFSYSDWMKDEPKNYNSGENSIVIFKDAKIGFNTFWKVSNDEQEIIRNKKNPSDDLGLICEWDY